MATVDVNAKNTASSGKQRCCICRGKISPHVRHFAYEVVDPDDDEIHKEFGAPPMNPVLRACSEGCRVKLEGIVDDGLVATAQHRNPHASFMYYIVEKDVKWRRNDK